MDNSGIGGIDRELIDKIIETILRRKSVEKIVIFGSRASGDHGRTSDIDIAVFAEKWSRTDFALTKDDLEETVLTPLKFDLVDYHDLAEGSLKNNILAKGKVIYDKRTDQAALRGL
ncbi:MAG: nucleotidyltransferase domain-containing protein [Candidatus Omnitrophica bacterium]|nr:nucleotidyltransferase domain-containing protein [Candidatus Omnitrophota bacterium]